MFNSIRELIIKICAMLGIVVDSAEDLAYASKALTGTARAEAEGFEKEQALKRAAAHERLDKELKAAAAAD